MQTGADHASRLHRNSSRSAANSLAPRLWPSPKSTLTSSKESPSSIAFERRLSCLGSFDRHLTDPSMPTFIIFKSGVVVETIKGADPRGLASAIDKAVKGAKPQAAYAYTSPGHTLGAGPARGNLSRPSFNPKSFFDALVTFFGLYVYSLFSFDAYTAAEKSPFNINQVVRRAPATLETRTGAATQVGKKLGRISDFGH
jgi:hypothetical protein